MHLPFSRVSTVRALSRIRRQVIPLEEATTAKEHGAPPASGSVSGLLVVVERRSPKKERDTLMTPGYYIINHHAAAYWKYLARDCKKNSMIDRRELQRVEGDVHLRAHIISRWANALNCHCRVVSDSTRCDILFHLFGGFFHVCGKSVPGGVSG